MLMLPPLPSSLPSHVCRYEYSLGSFLTVFNLTLHTSKKDSMLEGRLRNVIEALTYDVYSYTCLGLFERHKLMFSFQMTIKILEGGSMGVSGQGTGGWVHGGPWVSGQGTGLCGEGERTGLNVYPGNGL